MAKFLSFFILGVNLLLAQVANETIPKVIEPKLLVDDGESVMASYGDANLIMTNKYFKLKERLNSRRWQGYQGNIKISESRFFEVAGFNQEAKMAGRYQTVRRSVFWSGTGMIVLGGLITTVEVVRQGNSWHFPPVGIGLLVTGIGLEALWYFAPPNNYSLAKALAAADKYNQGR
ncbi:MAG: hypothetical protein ABIK93_07640 [candidate division WOR-3 bacterium]